MLYLKSYCSVELNANSYQTILAPWLVRREDVITGDDYVYIYCDDGGWESTKFRRNSVKNYESAELHLKYDIEINKLELSVYPRKDTLITSCFVFGMILTLCVSSPSSQNWVIFFWFLLFYLAFIFLMVFSQRIKYKEELERIFRLHNIEISFSRKVIA